tara:strand:- start:660 stop:929 length:270 start_codon:yes stop_codon:yes gene_type:complete
MDIDIKSVLIGALLTINIILIMGFDSKSIEHTHDTNEIKYNEWGYAGYGTLKYKIQDMEDDIGDSADKNHDHYFDYAKKGHSHSSYDIY